MSNVSKAPILQGDPVPAEPKAKSWIEDEWIRREESDDEIGIEFLLRGPKGVARMTFDVQFAFILNFIFSVIALQCIDLGL